MVEAVLPYVYMMALPAPLLQNITGGPKSFFVNIISLDLSQLKETFHFKAQASIFNKSLFIRANVTV